MNKEKYIVIQQWMISSLGLKGSELITYALIYGINQNRGKYYGSAEYLAETWLGITPKKGYRVLASMVTKGLLSKTVENGRIYYEALMPEKDTDLVPKGGSDNIDNIDNINNINNNNNIINDGSKMEPQKQTRKKAETVENLCLFADSKFNDFNKFLEQFKGPDFERLDMWYYYSVVSDWSASNGAKKRDWIATTRNWIRSDKERGKLHLNQQAGVALDPSAVKYLQEMGDGLF